MLFPSKAVAELYPKGSLKTTFHFRSSSLARARGGERLPIIYVRFDNYTFDLERRVLRLGY